MGNDFVYVTDISSKVDETPNYRGIAAIIGFIAGASIGFAANGPIAPAFYSIFGLYAGVKAAEKIAESAKKRQNRALEAYYMGSKCFDDNGKIVSSYQFWFELRKHLKGREKRQITSSLKMYYREATRRGKEFSEEEANTFRAL